MFCHGEAWTLILVCACKSFSVWSCPIADWAIFIECTYSWSNKDWEALKSSVGRFTMDVGDRGTRFAMYTLYGDVQEVTSFELYSDLKSVVENILKISRKASNETNILGALKEFRKSVLFRMRAGVRIFFLVTVGVSNLNVSQLAAEKLRIDKLQTKDVRVLRFLLHFQPYKAYSNTEMFDALKNVGVDGLYKVDGLPHKNMFKVFSHISSQINLICRVATAAPLNVCHHFDENGNLVSAGSDFCAEPAPKQEAGSLEEGDLTRPWELGWMPTMVGLTLPHRPDSLSRVDKSEILSPDNTVVPPGETGIQSWSQHRVRRSDEICACLLYVAATGNYDAVVTRSEQEGDTITIASGDSICIEKDAIVSYMCKPTLQFKSAKTKIDQRCDKRLTDTCEEITCAVREIASRIKNARIGATKAQDVDKVTVFMGMEIRFFCKKGWMTAETRSTAFGVMCTTSGWRKSDVQSCSSLIRNCVVRIPHKLNYIVTDLADKKPVMDDSSVIVPLNGELNFKCMDQDDTTFIVRRSVENTFSKRCSPLGELEVPPTCKEVCGFMMKKYPHFVAIDDQGHHLEPDGPNWVILNSIVSVTCDPNAQWTHTKSKTIVFKCQTAWNKLKTPPPCIASTCLVRLPELPHFSVFVNGKLIPPVSGNHTSTLELPLSSTAEWRCDKGYSWKADAVNVTTECDSHGNVLPVVPPPCTDRRCHVPAIKHAASDPPTPTYILFGEIVNYTCLDGYGLSQEKYIFEHRCEGKDLALPTDRCTHRENCTILVSPDNQTVTYQERAMEPTTIRPNVINGLWTVVNVKCRKPFEHLDRSMSKDYRCVGDNTWRPQMLGCYDRDHWLDLLRNQVETDDQLTNILIGVIPGVIVIAILAFLWMFLEKRRKLNKDLDIDADPRAKGKKQGFFSKLFGSKTGEGLQEQVGSQDRLGSHGGNAGIRDETIMPDPGSEDSDLANLQSPGRDEGGSDRLDRRASDISDLVESSDDSEEVASRNRKKDNDVDSLGSDKYKLFGGDKKRGAKVQGPRIDDDSPSPIQSPMLRLASPDD